MKMLLYAIMQMFLSATTPTVADLAPLVVIFILILAAAGLTRGTDIFAFFGVTGLLGLTRPGGGGAGKGLSSGRTRSKIQGANTKGIFNLGFAKSLTGPAKAAVYVGAAAAVGGVAGYAITKKGAANRQATVQYAQAQAQKVGYGSGSQGFVSMATTGGLAHGALSKRRANRLIAAEKAANAAKIKYHNSALKGQDARLGDTALSSRFPEATMRYHVWRHNRGLEKDGSAGSTWAMVPLVRIPVPLPTTLTRGAAAKEAAAQKRFDKEQYLSAKAMGIVPPKENPSPLPPSSRSLHGNSRGAVGFRGGNNPPSPPQPNENKKSDSKTRKLYEEFVSGPTARTYVPPKPFVATTRAEEKANNHKKKVEAQQKIEEQAEKKKTEVFYTGHISAALDKMKQQGGEDTAMRQAQSKESVRQKTEETKDWEESTMQERARQHKAQQDAKNEQKMHDEWVKHLKEEQERRAELRNKNKKKPNN